MSFLSSDANSSACELVLFWDDERIDRSMMFSDFEATLDNVVGIPAYAGQTRRGGYVRLNPQLSVTACVLFTIDFAKDGFPDRSWNIPLRHLADVALRGPDLGGGPIQLACRSQCPVSWHARALWDPVMGSEFNTFSLLQQEVPALARRFGFSRQDGSTSEAEYPVLTEAAPLIPPPANWEQERNTLELRLREQQLRIATLETDKAESINRLVFLHQQQIDILEAQNKRLMAQFRAMKTESDGARDQVDALRGQIETSRRLDQSKDEAHQLQVLQLNDAIQARVGEEAERLQDMLARHEQEMRSREQSLREAHQLDLQRRLDEENSRHQAQLLPLLNELRHRDDNLQTLRGEMERMRADHASAQQTLFDSLLAKLADLGMNFVVFHAGLGTISIPVSDIAEYMQNPKAYAAARCLVSEAHYRSWLAHYENPRCTAQIGENKCCDARLIRIDSPSRFQPGQSDRCARHVPADFAIENVLRFH